LQTLPYGASMPLLHDPAVHSSIQRRIQALRPGAQRQWGKMSIDQMLWHCNQPLLESLGRLPPCAVKPGMSKRLLKMIVLGVPWTKGAPTNPDFVAKSSCDFAAEHTRMLQLVDEVVATPMEGTWPESASFGRMSGRDWSRLHAKHLDHHLRQFGA
jgi:uncharacterized protein DUF1569